MEKIFKTPKKVLVMKNNKTTLRLFNKRTLKIKIVIRTKIHLIVYSKKTESF